MITNLAVNGCSYMVNYAVGNGHKDLAQQLDIHTCEDLSMPGCCNNRILRTTLKHSYQSEPTLYVLGMTFISRFELPINHDQHNYPAEGRWVNPQSQRFHNHWDHFWNEKLNDRYIELTRMTEVHSLLDRVEDLMYRILSTVSDLKARGHQVVVFQQVDRDYLPLYNTGRLDPFDSANNIIDGFRWLAAPYQQEQGVPVIDTAIPIELRKPKPGHHQVLNKFLVEYIREHRII